MQAVEDQQASHPFIAYLIRILDDLDMALAQRENPDMGEAYLNGALKTLYSLHPGTQNTEEAKNLETLLQRCIMDRNSLGGEFPMDVHNKRVAFDGLMLGSYQLWLRNLKSIIWDGGYFNDEFYKKAIPTAGDNVSGKQDLKSLPSVMSSRVE